MEAEKNHLDTLNDIRSMMEKSSRFISLSGLSGIFAGVFALLGTAAAFIYLNADFLSDDYYKRGIVKGLMDMNFVQFFFIDGLLVLILSVTFGILFTVRNSIRKSVPYWGRTAKLTVLNLFAPLAVGGFFCLVLLYHQVIYLVAPATLVFYGLALINAGKYTLREVTVLGIIETIVGIIACFFAGYGLLFWAFGFGVLHIIYGIIMYNKYEKS